ncbi:hypothetical protein EHI48_13555 [Rhizobium sp. WSM1325]|nr:hypothetical protein EHI48_13555 [Rhizobium leguminosarum]
MRRSGKGGSLCGKAAGRTVLHNSLNRNRFKDKIMQQFKVLQPLRVHKDARRCNALKKQDRPHVAGPVGHREKPRMLIAASCPQA